eukprot:jgi/Galph1/4232/GphlegSOOS_G2891.1
MFQTRSIILLCLICAIVSVQCTPLVSSNFAQGHSEPYQRTSDTPRYGEGSSYEQENTVSYMIQPHIPFIPIGSPSVANSLSYASDDYAQALSAANAISFLGHASAATNATVQGYLAFSNATATASGLGLVETDAATSSLNSYSGNIEVAFTIGGTVTAHSDSFSAPGFGTVTVSGFGGAGPFGLAAYGEYPQTASRLLVKGLRKAAAEIF